MSTASDTSAADLRRSAVAALDPVPVGAARQRALAAVKRDLLKRPASLPVLGRYRLGARLGHGAMGVVHRGHDPELGRDVAIKIVRPRLREERPADARRQLEREAKALGSLNHPNVVTVFDVGIAGDEVFIVMELVAGANLRDWVAERRPDAAAILEVFAAAGRGLAAAHRAGVVHCDFKPENVLVGADGSVKVTDFGLARLSPAATPRGLADAADSGTPAGTPAYAAPEQVRGEPGPASDQFAFCIALFEALYGRQPLPLTSWQTRRRAIETGALQLDPGTPRPLRRVLRRGLQADPARRWPSMAALLAALQPRPSRRRTWAAVGGAAIVGAVALAAMRFTAPTPAVARTAFALSTPADPRLAARAVNAESLRASGHYADAMTLAATVVEDAGPGDARARAAAQLVIGRALAHLRQAAKAREALHTAYVLATEAGDDATALRCAIEMVFLVGHADADLEGAARWSRAARTLIARLPADDADLHEADLLENEAAVAFKAGRVGEAVDTAEDALALRETAGQTRVSGLGNLVNYHLAAGDLPRAREVLTRALATTPPEHSNHARLLMVEGALARRDGDLEHARTVLEQALDEARRSPETRLVLQVPILINLGYLLVDAGEREQGAIRFAEAAAVIDGTPDAPVELRLESLHSVGRSLVEAGDVERGTQAFRDATDLAERTYDAPHPERVSARADLATAHAAGGERELALFHFEQALDNVPDAPARFTAPYAGSLVVIAAGLVELGRPARAAALLEPMLEAGRTHALPPHDAGQLAVILAHARAAAGGSVDDACALWRSGADRLAAMGAAPPRLEPALRCPSPGR